MIESRMLVDFCHGLWDTRIDSDVVSSDGYEISNLISRDKSKKQKGFLAAGFVKPVVTILLSFPFPVDLYALNISPRVGAQETCGLEIFAASLNARNNQNVGPNAINITEEDRGSPTTQRRAHHPHGRPRIPRTNNNCWEFSGLHHYQDDLNINNIKQEFKNLFVQILQVRIPEGNIGHFLNPCFQPPPQVQCDSRIVENACADVHKCLLQQGRLLRRISHLLVRITQVHKCSVPCIGAVEVLGQPAQNSGTFVMNYATLISSRLKKEKDGLYTVLTAGHQAPCVGSSEGSSLTTLSTDTSLPNDASSLSEHIPEDFIDPITLSIMSLPVLLPCGTTIDQTTLERHIDSEKNWGRPPSDPFTGLPLGSKVIPNAALKFRIDNFLLSSDVSVRNLGRTVGSILDCRSTTKVKVNGFREGSKLQKNQLLQKISGKRNVIINESDDSQVPTKRQKTGDLDKALEEALNARRQPAIFNHNLSVSSLIKKYGSKSNEKNCDTDEISHAGCPHQGQDSILFQLPCQHVICRRCLTGALGNNQCPNCKRNFDKKNVARVHSIYTNT